MISSVGLDGVSRKTASAPGAKAAFCTPEELFVYPWAKVDIMGGDTVYADGDGHFTNVSHQANTKNILSSTVFLTGATSSQCQA